MKNTDKGISLVALIITIIIIIILATIMASYSNDTIDTAGKMVIETEFRNVEELVFNAKAKVLADEIEIPDTYVATSSELDAYKGNSSLDISTIKAKNNNSQLEPKDKYHLMNQSAFSSIFKDDINVKNIKHTYLVNFTAKVVILVDGDKVYKSGDIQ